MIVVGHRGWSQKYPENTLASFRGALDLGVDAIELDVHVTADDHVVVIHDEDVERTTDGKGPVREMTLAEVKTLDAGGWFDAKF
ncbi:MAG TPA: glycerophosphodiester phosphodiesterase family protein, partial [Planctomycetota bacterium]|nr:glycerophosphodiester phosphodiesterase family protein [Planctomycetota bacterium]